MVQTRAQTRQSRPNGPSSPCSLGKEACSHNLSISTANGCAREACGGQPSSISQRLLPDTGPFGALCNSGYATSTPCTKGNMNTQCPGTAVRHDDALCSATTFRKPALASSPPITHVDIIPRWQKVLYREQPFADSHTDDTFLAELIVNAALPERHYWPVVWGSTAVTQQLSTVSAVVSVSVYLFKGSMAVAHLLGLISLVTVAGGAFALAAGRRMPGGSLQRALRQCTLLTTGVYLLSPLLQTLTKSVSSDSIVATSCWLLGLHLCFHDYTFVDSVTASLTGSLSLAAAVGASVLIASRLQTAMHVFAQVLFSLEMYLLAPYVRRYVKQVGPWGHVVLTLGMCGGSVALIALLSLTVACMYVAGLIMVTFVCPLWVVRADKFKAKINGPWDEAVPEITLTLAQQT